MHPKAFWQNFKNSLTSAEYYVQVLKNNGWYSFKYFLMVMVILGIALAYEFGQKQLPYIEDGARQSVDEALQNYPDDLQIGWDGQSLVLEPDEELSVPYPSFVMSEVTQSEVELPKNVAYLTRNQVDPAEQNIDAWLVVDQDEVYVNDLNEGWTSNSLADALTSDIQFVLTKEMLPEIQEWINFGIGEMADWTKVAGYVLAPLSLIFIKLWSALIEGFLVFLLFKINRIALSFKKTFQLSLHLTVTAELVSLVAHWLYPQMSFPMFTLAYWLILLYVWFSQGKKMGQLDKLISSSIGGKGKSS